MNMDKSDSRCDALPNSSETLPKGSRQNHIRILTLNPCECCGEIPTYEKHWGIIDEGYFICKRCGKRTPLNPMTWQSADAWNSGDTYYDESVEQISLF